MRLGIDVDGVLGRVTAPGVVEPWRASQFLEDMITALLGREGAHHRIFFITACCGADDIPERFEALRQKHLDILGLHGLGSLVLTRYGEKGIICHGLSIDVFIDDQDDNLADVARDSPQTVCLKFIGSVEQACVPRSDSEP